jgi:hypothetical protein
MNALCARRPGSYPFGSESNIMARFVAVTLSDSTQDKAIYINVEQVRTLRWSQNTGSTTVVFEAEQSIMVTENPQRILESFTLAR